MRYSAIFLALLGAALPGAAAPDESPNIDPLALRVLQAACDSLKNAANFSFHAIVARDHMGTNGQIITMFNSQNVLVSRPDKLRVDFKAQAQDVTLYDNAGQVVLYSPGQKLYATVDGAKTIEATLDNLEKREISLALGPFLRSDPYAVAVDGLTSAAVIGRAEIAGKVYHHLAFTESDADWQMWVEAGEHPTPRRVEVIYKNMPGAPRVAVDFSEWNLDANPEPGEFTFQKPPDAHQIEFLKFKTKAGGD